MIADYLECNKVCGDMLLTSPCILHYSYHNVQWGHWLTYMHMYLYQSLFVPVYAYAARRRSCAALAGCRPSFWPVCWRDCVFKLRARFLNTLQVGRCWIKIKSAVNLGEKLSSEFVQCVLWVIRLTKTVESICCAVCHTVTLPRAVWWTVCSPHSVEFWQLWRLTPAITDRLPPVLSCQQTVLSVRSTTPCANVLTACC